MLPGNLLGLPAACVPTKVINGFPMGAQIIGDRFREDLCLDAAATVEAAFGVLTPVIAGAEASNGPPAQSSARIAAL